MSKDYLLEQLRLDEERYDKYQGDKLAKTWRGMQEAIRDPSVRIIPLDNTITGPRVKVVQIGLRIMESEQVPTKIAEEYARTLGHAGNVAFRVEQYDWRMARKWGPNAPKYFTEQRFLRYLAERDRGKASMLTVASGDEQIDIKRIRRINLLRAACRGCEMFDLPPEELHGALRHFGRLGVMAFDLEDYASRHLSRREQMRKL